MAHTISPNRIAAMLAGFDRHPAYAGLAVSLQRMIGEGRIPTEAKLPSERDLCRELGVSRTTVSRAYAQLAEIGFARAQLGAGTFTQIPGGARRALDNALLPYSGDEDAIDLNCAAAAAPFGIAEACERAAHDLYAHLGSHGYYPTGLPDLQAAIADHYRARGLATDPEQIIVTPGALSAAAIVAKALTKTGDRIVVEAPSYPNAPLALAHAGARLVPFAVDPLHRSNDGWDLDALADTFATQKPSLAYGVVDFHNPTGHLMTEDQRQRYADLLAAHDAMALIDEAHVGLNLNGQPMPAPFASFAANTISIGSASKSYWGGLRVGWIRAPHRVIPTLTKARVSLDLGAPVFEQLAVMHLLTGDGRALAAQQSQLREQRDALVAAVAKHLPDWQFAVPSGGMSLWCELPASASTALVAEAERHGVIMAAGPVFGVRGGLGRFVRIPWAKPAEMLTEAARRLAEAWAATTAQSLSPERALRPRIHVA